MQEVRDIVAQRFAWKRVAFLAVLVLPGIVGACGQDPPSTQDGSATPRGTAYVTAQPTVSPTRRTVLSALTPTPTLVGEASVTPTATDVPETTATASAAAQPTASPTPGADLPTLTPTPTATAEPTATPTPTVAPEFTATASAAAQPTASPTPRADPSTPIPALTSVVAQGTLEEAPVEGVTISFAPDGGSRLTLTAGLPSGCHRAVEPSGYMAADKIVIEAQNLVSVGAACTDDYRTVEMRLALGGELVACAVYNVIVNGERHVVQAIAPKLRCSASGSVERRSSDNETTITEEEAPIRSLAIQIVKSNTPQYVAVVLSGQGGGCTGPGGYFVERDHQTIRVTVTNLNYSTKGVACTLEYAIGETIIPLGHAFDPHTAYTLVMNGETRASFTTDGAALGEESGRREVKLVPSDAVDGGSEDPNNVVVVPVLTFVENHQDPDENLLGLFLASSVTISPDGNHIYVTSPFAGTVTVFSRDLTTGALAYVEVQKDGVDGVEGLAGAQSVVISPDGRNLYATGASSDAVVVFDRNLTTGALTFVEFHSEARSGVDGLSWLASVTISPDGEHIYVAGLSDGAVVVFSRNSTKGTLTFVEAKRRLDNVLSVTVSPDGKHLYAVGQRDDAVAVYNRNTRTGTLTFVEVHKGGAVGFGRASSVVVSPDGKHVYVAGQGDSVAAVYSRNSTTGALTLLDFYRGYQGGFSYATMVTFSPDGKYLYAAGRYPNVVGIYRRNPSTGAITYLEARIDGVEAVEGLAFSEMLMVSPDGKHIYAIGFDSVAVFSVLLPTDTEGD